MPGGVTGKARESLPMSISGRQSHPQVHSAIALLFGVDSVDHNPLNMGLWGRENDH